MLRLTVVAVLYLTLVPAAPALAQSVPTRGATAKPVLTVWVDITSMSSTTSTPPQEGAYERLSAGNRKIARAIFEAQTPDGTDTLTLDQIAAIKQSGQAGWSSIYKDMHARGLVTETTLAAALTRYNRQQHGSRDGTK